MITLIANFHETLTYNAISPRGTPYYGVQPEEVGYLPTKACNLCDFFKKSCICNTTLLLHLCNFKPHTIFLILKCEGCSFQAIQQEIERTVSYPMEMNSSQQSGGREAGEAEI